ncbi:type IVB secretion system protein IcmH/DotU [uncultured Neptuniibacter sp.]|uniref:type IVB secretion system protein IcmH/DotU n=1 Tax=uncultured Neptuniibacter sp. TaxID=502143 RepID=UPI0032B13ABA
MEDQTIIRPTPGGRRPQRAGSNTGHQQDGGQVPQSAQSNAPRQNAGQAQPGPQNQSYQPPQQSHNQQGQQQSFQQPQANLSQNSDYQGSGYQSSGYQGSGQQSASHHSSGHNNPAQQSQGYQQQAQPQYQQPTAQYQQPQNTYQQAPNNYQQPEANYQQASTGMQGHAVEPMQDNNPLLALVAPLLAFTSKIQSASECPNLDEYHRYSLDQLNFYRSQGWGINADPNTAYQVSYAICSLIDEIVLNTPWGSTSKWSGDSMLINLHQEAWGGENFFNYLQELMQRPSTNLLVLEFYYCCLSLGFEGKYRRLANGRRELDQLRSELYVMIARQRDREPQGLSPAWFGLDVAHQGFVRHLPQWVVWSVASVLLAASYIGFNWYLNQQSDQVMTTLAQIGQADKLQVTPVNIDKLNRYVPAEAPVLDFQRVDLVGMLTPPLKAELDSGVIELIDNATHTRVRIRHSKLFASGQSDVSARFIPLIERIGEIIPELSAPIEVQGHSDNVPIFSARFPSNWVLSKSRADAVGKLLQQNLPPQQTVRTEGLADSEPLVPNSSAQNRALNRRVEIVLRK